MRVSFAASVAVLVLLAGCSEAGDQVADPTNSPASAESIAEQRASASPTESEPSIHSESPEPAAPPRDATDRLLPEKVLEAYAPSYPLNMTASDAKRRSLFPEMTQVRPKDCLDVLQLFTTPLENPDGVIASYAGNYVNIDFPGPMFYQRIFVFDTPAVASDFYAQATSQMPDCKTASGRWAQQGSVKFGDGFYKKDLKVGNIRELNPEAVIYEDVPGYDDRIQGAFAFALANDAVIVSEFSTYDKTSNKKRRDLMNQFVMDGVAYSLTGDVPEPANSNAATQLTLDCLAIRPLPYTVYENYSQFHGKGAGEDLFVETREEVTNNCGKDVRGFKYDVTFIDEFGDEFFSGNGTVRISIAAGGTKKTPKDQGFVIRSFLDDKKMQIFMNTDPTDVTVELRATQILFTDKTSLP